MIDFLSRAQSLKEEVFSVREYLHRHPEIGNNEVCTSSFIANYLSSLGLEVKKYLNTAIVARLKGSKKGKTIALRADMDALPIVEKTNCSFKSENSSFMHACGHDIHMTSALICAKLLSEVKDKLIGDVLFVFQPDEEGSGGALRLIEQNALDGVCAVYGFHVSPELELGQVGIKYGKFYAASDVFTITVKGSSCHGATPEKGRSALLASCAMINELSNLKLDSQDPFVLSIGTINSGSACNIIPSLASFSGIIRTLGPENRMLLKDKIVKIIEQVSLKYSVKSEIDIKSSYGGIVNTDRETKFLEDSALKIFGKDNVIILNESTMTTEDFGYYIDKYSGSFCHLGCGCKESLHSEFFLPKSETAIYGSALFSKLIFDQIS